MAEQHFTTTPEKNAPSPPPTEAITPGCTDSGATAETPAVKTPIEEPCDVREALSIIKAMGDCLVCIHECH